MELRLFLIKDLQININDVRFLFSSHLETRFQHVNTFPVVKHLLIFFFFH